MSERRRYPRVPTELSARVLFHWKFVLECTVRDISAGGACLEIADSTRLPEVFDLIIAQVGDVHACQVRWRAGDRIGVSFH
jgi:hypothetical protein